jgi:2-dehydro-3-deoxygluconokinase
MSAGDGGAEGALAPADGEQRLQPPLPVEAIDTVGAGDAFVAGYLAELLDGAGLEARLRTAAARGGVASTAPGDREAAPDRAAIARLLGGGDPVQR